MVVRVGPCNLYDAQPLGASGGELAFLLSPEVLKEEAVCSLCSSWQISFE